uniref:Uncharacterized protein n=1 Tax=Arundo donax TaxID=35708 RepID=A0A0A9GLL6_ARUDO
MAYAEPVMVRLEVWANLMRPLQIAQANASNYAHAVDTCSSSSACLNLDDKDRPINLFLASKSAFL